MSGNTTLDSTSDLAWTPKAVDSVSQGYILKTRKFRSLASGVKPAAISTGGSGIYGSRTAKSRRITTGSFL